MARNFMGKGIFGIWILPVYSAPRLHLQHPITFIKWVTRVQHYVALRIFHAKLYTSNMYLVTHMVWMYIYSVCIGVNCKSSLIWHQHRFWHKILKYWQRGYNCMRMGNAQAHRGNQCQYDGVTLGWLKYCNVSWTRNIFPQSYTWCWYIRFDSPKHWKRVQRAIDDAKLWSLVVYFSVPNCLWNTFLCMQKEQQSPHIQLFIIIIVELSVNIYKYVSIMSTYSVYIPRHE